MEEKSFNPSEHIAWPDGQSKQETPDALHPEFFVSLEAVVDVEEARIAAEAIQQRLKPFFEDVATAEIMLAEATSKEDQKMMEEEIESIRNRISEEIKKRVGIFRPRNIRDILSGSSYKPIAYWYHHLRSGAIIDRRFLSEDEKKLLERYGDMARKKALEFLSEANEDQKSVITFLSAHGFHIPEAPGAEQDENRRFFGDLFCSVADYATKFSLPRDSDDAVCEKFKNKFRDWYNSLNEDQKIFDIEAYLVNPKVKEVLRLWRHFGIETSGPQFTGVGVSSQDPTKGGWVSGGAQFSGSALSVRYDVSDIREALREKAEEFIVPGAPNYVQIIEIPFNRKLGDDLSAVSQSAEEFANKLQEDPQKVLAQMDKFGEQGAFRKFQLDKLFEEQPDEQKRSVSFLFLGA